MAAYTGRRSLLTLKVIKELIRLSLHVDYVRSTRPEVAVQQGTRNREQCGIRCNKNILTRILSERIKAISEKKIVFKMERGN